MKMKQSVLPLAAAFLFATGLHAASAAESGKPRLGLGLRNAVLVHKVLPGGVAAKAGFRVGDAILAVNGQAVADTQEAAAAIQGAPAGDIVFKVVRSGRELTLTTGKDAARSAPAGGRAGTSHDASGKIDQ